MYKQIYDTFAAVEKSKSKYCKCLYFSANALAREMTKMADKSFFITGLSSSLAFVVMSVAQQPGISPSEIGTHMQLTPSTVTRLLEKLEYKKLLYRETNGRQTLVFLTDTGSNLYPQILTCWNALYQEYSKLLGEEYAIKLTREIYDSSLKIS